MMRTHKDIYFIVGLINRFQNNPGDIYQKAINRILRYMHEMTDYMLCYQRRDARFCGYSNTDYVSEVDGFKSTSRYAILLNGAVISSLTKKQSCRALSIMVGIYHM